MEDIGLGVSEGIPFRGAEGNMYYHIWGFSYKDFGGHIGFRVSDDVGRI